MGSILQAHKQSIFIDTSHIQYTYTHSSHKIAAIRAFLRCSVLCILEVAGCILLHRLLLKNKHWRRHDILPYARFIYTLYKKCKIGEITTLIRRKIKIPTNQIVTYYNARFRIEAWAVIWLASLFPLRGGDRGQEKQKKTELFSLAPARPLAAEVRMEGKSKCWQPLRPSGCRPRVNVSGRWCIVSSNFPTAVCSMSLCSSVLTSAPSSATEFSHNSSSCARM